MQDPIKEAFSRVKQEIDYLTNELAIMKEELEQLKSQHLKTPTQEPITQAYQPQESNTSTQIPTLNSLITPYNPQFPAISTGNEGVPTDRQTDRQSDRHPNTSTPNTHKGSFNKRIDRLEKVSELLGSLDELKKEIRLKFKRLTNQEMSVYISIYQLEEQGFSVDYSLLAEKLGLTESSIRDYIRKMIGKGIPLMKIKENNQRILLSIPTDLKKIASINTIIQLRDI